MGKTLQKSNKTFQRNFRGWDNSLEKMWIKCKALIELQTGETKVNAEIQRMLMEQFIANHKDNVTV